MKDGEVTSSKTRALLLKISPECETRRKAPEQQIIAP
jgi:hypothetical protein